MDISVAVATPRGLVVPVLRNVESMDYPRIELALNALALKARDGNLKEYSQKNQLIIAGYRMTTTT